MDIHLQNHEVQIKPHILYKKGLVPVIHKDFNKKTQLNSG